MLEAATGKQHIPDKVAMRRIYKALRARDDGLLPIDQTRLLSKDLWGFQVERPLGSSPSGGDGRRDPVVGAG